MPPTELTKLSKTEQELMGEILSGKNKAIEISIPDDLPAKTIVKYTMSVSSLLHKNEGEKAVLIAVLGRLHFLARTNAEVLKEAECETLGDFEKLIGGSGASRSSIWAASAAYKTFPGLTPNDYSDIGSTNLGLASKACKEASPAQKKKVLAAAVGKSTEEFKGWLEKKSGLSAPGENTASNYPLMGSKAQVDELREWLADDGFKDWAGSDQPIAMILAAIHEATTQFETEPKAIAAPAKEDGW